MTLKEFKTKTAGKVTRVFYYENGKLKIIDGCIDNYNNFTVASYEWITAFTIQVKIKPRKGEIFK